MPAYGNEPTTSSMARRYTNGAMPGSRGFTSQRRDDAPDLAYYGARYYDQEAGVFLSADSVLDGLNRYEYVGGNPETWTDPTGHIIEWTPDDFLKLYLAIQFFLLWFNGTVYMPTNASDFPGSTNTPTQVSELGPEELNPGDNPYAIVEGLAAASGSTNNPAPGPGAEGHPDIKDKLPGEDDTGSTGGTGSRSSPAAGSAPPPRRKTKPNSNQFAISRLEALNAAADARAVQSSSTPVMVPDTPEQIPWWQAAGEAIGKMANGVREGLNNLWNDLQNAPNPFDPAQQCACTTPADSSDGEDMPTDGDPVIVDP